MSDSQAYEEISISSDGVRVVKRFEEDEFPVPAIAFEFESERNETVTVRLSDTVPDSIEVEDLGFHPEYGSEYWTIDEETITFERDIDANAEYTTVYGIRATGSDDVQQFLTEPTLEKVDPPLPDGESLIPESDDAVVKNAIAGDGEIPGLEDDDNGTDTEDVETLDLKDPNAPEQETTGATDSDDGEGESADESTDETTAEVSVDGETLITAMANELREQAVDADDVKLLRRAFELAAEEEGSNSARIEQLQRDISDLRAYTGALQEFLDENGTGEELIQGFEEQLDAFDSKLDSLESTVESTSSEVDSLGEEVDSVSDEMSSFTEEVESVTEEVESVSNDVDSVSDEVNSVSGDVDDLEGSIEDIERSVETLEEQVTEGEVAERVDEIEESLSDLQDWQEQIKKTFGG